jgi:hypothetical protein
VDDDDAAVRFIGFQELPMEGEEVSAVAGNQHHAASVRKAKVRQVGVSSCSEVV